MKAILCAVVSLVVLVGPAPWATAAAPPPPAISSAAGIMIDVRGGRILWSHNDEVRRPPASLTKILTALVAIESDRLLETAAITPEARTVHGGRTFAEQGWTFTIQDHVWGLMLQSGNDSAVAIAQHLSPDGTVAGFMSIANDRAARLGAKNTYFTNPHGLDEPEHLTTARDLGLITMVAMREPLFAKMVASKTHDVPWGDGTQHTYINHNKLLWRYEGAVGVKTGFTSGAGHSLASAVKRGEDMMIVVLLGSPDHYGESIALYDWAFGNLEALRAANPVGFIRPGATTTEAPADTEHDGLEIVEIDGAAQASGPLPEHSSAPLAAPIVALAAAVGVAWAIKRRRSGSRVVFEELDTSYVKREQRDPAGVG